MKTKPNEVKHKSPKIIVFGGPKGPNIDPTGLFLAAGGALARQTTPRRGKKHEQRGKKQPKRDLRALQVKFLAPLKTDTPPRGGGGGVLRPSVLEHFS